MIEDSDIITKFIKQLKKDFPNDSIELQSTLPYSSIGEGFYFVINGEQTLLFLNAITKKYNTKNLDETFKYVKKEIKRFLRRQKMSLENQNKKEELKEEKTVKIEPEKVDSSELETLSDDFKEEKKIKPIKERSLKSPLQINNEQIAILNSIKAVKDFFGKYDIGARIENGQKIKVLNAFTIKDETFKDTICLQTVITDTVPVLISFDRDSFENAIKDIKEMQVVDSDGRKTLSPNKKEE